MVLTWPQIIIAFFYFVKVTYGDMLKKKRDLDYSCCIKGTNYVYLLLQFKELFPLRSHCQGQGRLAGCWRSFGIFSCAEGKTNLTSFDFFLGPSCRSIHLYLSGTGRVNGTTRTCFVDGTTPICQKLESARQNMLPR